jgi:hypothetical protein
MFLGGDLLFKLPDYPITNYQSLKRLPFAAINVEYNHHRPAGKQRLRIATIKKSQEIRGL